MKIRTKLIAAIASLLVIILFSQGYSILSSKQLQTAYGEIFDDIELRHLLKSIQYNMAGMSNDERAYLLTGDVKYTQELTGRGDNVNKYFSQLTQISLDPNQMEALQKIEEQYKIFYAAGKRVREEYAAGKKEDALKNHFGMERNTRKEVDTLVADLLKQVETEVTADMQVRKDEMQSYTEILLTIMLISVIIGISIGFVAQRTIVKPILQVNRQLKDIAEGEGDLTRELAIQSKDEMGELSHSFNKMIESLRSMIHQVRSNAEQVAASSEELTASAEQTSKATEQIAATIARVAEGTQHQAHSVEEGTRSVEELFVAVQQVAGNASSASSTAIDTSEMASAGNGAIQTAVSQMESINETITTLATVVKGLGDRSLEIGQIVEVITDIAAQTNLLALNAAIEAARAGEQGRGFAVVADEVRKLAEQSSQSALRISDLISSIQTETSIAVESMESGKQEVADGISVVTKAGGVFAQIERAISDLASQIQEVSAASEQMSAGTAQAVGSMSVIKEVAQDAAAGTQEVSAATEQQLASMEEIASSAAALSRMSEELQSVIGRFKV